MSSSRVEPSKKLSWVKSMDAKLAREKRLQEAAVKIVDGGKPNNLILPTDKGGKEKPKALLQLAAFIEQAKIDKQRRQERDRQKQQQKKEESNQ